MHYQPDDLSLKDRTHPALSRWNALLCTACCLCSAARAGSVSAAWVAAFVRGSLRFARTHGQGLSPLDILVYAEELTRGNNQEAAREGELLWALPLNLVDPPQAAPPVVGAWVAVCRNFLLSLRPGFDRSVSPYF